MICSLEMIELNYWPPNDRNGPLMSGLRDRLFDLGYYPSILTQERLGLCDVTLQVWPSRYSQIENYSICTKNIFSLEY